MNLSAERHAPRLILTVDYEVFGNGSGCITNCVTRPAARIAGIASRYGAPVTYFVDALEFRSIEEFGADKEGSRAVRNQLRGLSALGHDVQLHIHPQWADTRAVGQSELIPVFGDWRIADVEPGLMHKLVEDSIRWLADVVPGNQGAHATFDVFRAGAWGIQPSDTISECLRSYGITIDSSVAPGLLNSRSGDWYDFRCAPAKPYWKAGHDILSEGGDGLLAIPIAVGRVAPHLRIAEALTRRWFGHSLAPGCVGSYEGLEETRSAVQVFIDTLRKSRRSMLDFCTLTASLMTHVANDWLETHKAYRARAPIPVVAIGHTKNFSKSAERHLDDFLRSWVDHGHKFATYKQWCQLASECL